MDKRLELHEILEAIIGPGKVYFQPPENTKMQYPCIVYHRDDANTIFAGNHPYHYTTRYKITVIDRNPDSPYPFQIAHLPMCRYDRFYTADNLNHDVYNLYF